MTGRFGIMFYIVFGGVTEYGVIEKSTATYG